jgi:hypothetical protein
MGVEEMDEMVISLRKILTSLNDDYHQIVSS